MTPDHEWRRTTDGDLSFGFLAVERVACLLLLLASAVGLAHAAQSWPEPWVPWATWEVSFGWLVLQAGLVAAGGIAALGSRSFVLAAVGIVAGLLFGTRVGAITVGPSLLVVTLIALRFRAFTIFARGGAARPASAGYRR